MIGLLLQRMQALGYATVLPEDLQTPDHAVGRGYATNADATKKPSRAEPRPPACRLKGAPPGRPPPSCYRACGPTADRSSPAGRPLQHSPAASTPTATRPATPTH